MKGNRWRSRASSRKRSMAAWSAIVRSQARNSPSVPLKLFTRLQRTKHGFLKQVFQVYQVCDFVVATGDYSPELSADRRVRQKVQHAAGGRRGQSWISKKKPKRTVINRMTGCRPVLSPAFAATQTVHFPILYSIKPSQAPTAPRAVSRFRSPPVRHTSSRE